MTSRAPGDYREVFEKLTEAVGEWESSPYYLPEEELFDLERFLADHGAEPLLVELKETYGTPLNHNFWSRNLAYRRLKKAREVVKEQERLQEEKKQAYQEALQQTREAHWEWIKEWIHSQRRAHIRVVRKNDAEDD